MTSPTLAGPEPQIRAQAALIERLVEVATAAIRNEAPGIEYDVRRLRGVVVEIEMAGGGVKVGNVYLQRRGKAD